MVSTPVSTASSFDTQMMQEVFDQAIEETCRNFGLLSPYKHELLTREDDIMKLLESKEDTTIKGDEDGECLTYDGMICKERAKKFPPSYYHVEEMNKGPEISRTLAYEDSVSVDFAPRLARIPSQYQLESLTEVYVCDYPSLFCHNRPCTEAMDVESLSTAFPTNHIVSEATELHPVYSEYVSEMLY
ncbi:unnamed protein product [Strongylus vulgaris]|uniref:Uncharacterized protein n=1 Tax=Strongylus vulgaris TaxID=40348 RepID=A0A3P7LPF6_STRVU|nr:unnamed protein product [Strongylus vulgaris]